MAYKVSRYNIFIDYLESYYLWNTYSNSFIKLNKEGKKWLDNFDGQQTDEQYFEILKANGCIVNKDMNEIGKLLLEEKSSMLDISPEKIHFTIAPGLDCNYRCLYCFEKGSYTNSRMDNDTLEKVFSFIIHKINSNKNIRELNIRWFGGEPLLHMDIIIALSRKLIKSCEEIGISYSAGIVTNGRLLSLNYATMLKELKVKYVQVSVDGMNDHYLKQKQAKAGDFEEVVKNIKLCSDVLDITVRINVSESIREAIKLTQYLLIDCELEKKIKVYIAHIRNYASKSIEEERNSHRKFLELEGEYISMFGKNGKYSLESLSFINPKRRCTTCKSVCGYNFCIGPAGEFYRCEHHYGRKEFVVGNVDSGRYYSNLELDFLSHTHNKDCLECKIFPICLGGCMNDNMEGKTVLACDSFYNRQIDYLLKAYFG